MTETDSEQLDAETDRLTPEDMVTLQLSQGERESLAKSLSVGIDTEDEKEDIQRIFRELINE